MSADGSAYVYPTGKTPDQLYLTLRSLIDRLNRVKSEDSTDLTAILAALEETQQEIQALWDAINEGGGGDGLTPQERFELSLVTAVQEQMGSVSNLVQDTIERSHKSAEAAIKATLAGLQNKGAINVEQVVRKSENEVFVSQLSTFEANLNNTQAAVEQEIIARTNGDEAIAETVETLTTTVDGNTAQIIVLANSIDGIEARWGVAINLQGQVIGLVQLDGTASGSEFTVVADKFQVALPEVNDGDPFPVLVLEEIDGVPSLALNGMLKVLALSSLSANLGTITAGLIRDPDDTVRFDLPNMRWYRTDGMAEIDLLNLRLRFGTED